MRISCRARIFEIVSQSRAIVSDVQLPVELTGMSAPLLMLDALTIPVLHKASPRSDAKKLRGDPCYLSNAHIFVNEHDRCRSLLVDVLLTTCLAWRTKATLALQQEADGDGRDNRSELLESIRSMYGHGPVSWAALTKPQESAHSAPRAKPPGSSGRGQGPLPYDADGAA